MTTRTTLTQQDIDGRPDDWNRMEFEACDPKRTMTEVLRNLVDEAWNTGYRTRRSGR